MEIDRTLRIPIELTISGRETVDVSSSVQSVETASTSLGQTVSQQQIVDLPLNGRNFTQLGLLQAGVVPLTNGLAVAGGALKAGQAFAVNGQRPESNNYLLDGGRNVNRMDGGFGIRTPIDAIQEFRILTHTASAEYGSNSGATVSVITRSGGNSLHGSVYYFGRNDAVDARNFFSSDVEPLKQHQYGATMGGPLRRNKVFLFGFWEGFRNRQGITKSATVPTPQERKGDFSGLQDPTTGNQLINFATGQPIPGNQIPAFSVQSGVAAGADLLSARQRIAIAYSARPKFSVMTRIKGGSSWTRRRAMRTNSPYVMPWSRDRLSTRYPFAALMFRVSRREMICLRIRRLCPTRTSSAHRR